MHGNVKRFIDTQSVSLEITYLLKVENPKLIKLKS